jgi:2'-5' RNA ligase
MRLFVAVNLPSDVRQDIWEAAEPLRGEGYPIRWVGPEAIHLTLKFLGEVGGEREAEITTALDGATQGTRSFMLPIEGFGAFPSLSRPRVVWAGCEGVPPLELLQHRLEQEMERVGFAIEGRAFHPHLTLGRVKRQARPGELRDFASTLEPLTYANEVEVRSVDLMQSELSREGATYTVRHAAEFES